MHIDAAVFGEQVSHQHEPLVNHGDKRVCALTPSVAVSDFLKDVGLFGEGFVADFDVHGKIGANIERRIDIDELDTALIIDFFKEGAVIEGG
jgi:hypothetical protein